MHARRFTRVFKVHALLGSARLDESRVTASLAALLSETCRGFPNWPRLFRTKKFGPGLSGSEAEINTL